MRGPAFARMPFTSKKFGRRDLRVQHIITKLEDLLAPVVPGWKTMSGGITVEFWPKETYDSVTVYPAGWDMTAQVSFHLGHDGSVRRGLLSAPVYLKDGEQFGVAFTADLVNGRLVFRNEGGHNGQSFSLFERALLSQAA